MDEPKPLRRLSQELKHALAAQRSRQNDGGSSTSSDGSPMSGPSRSRLGQPANNITWERQAAENSQHIRWGRLALPGTLLRPVEVFGGGLEGSGPISLSSATAADEQRSCQRRGGGISCSSSNGISSNTIATSSKVGWAAHKEKCGHAWAAAVKETAPGTVLSMCSTAASSSDDFLEVQDSRGCGKGTAVDASQSEGRRPFTLASCLRPLGDANGFGSLPLEVDLDEEHFARPGNSDEESTDSCPSYDVTVQNPKILEATQRSHSSVACETSGAS